MCRWDCFVISLELCIPKVIEELKINFLFKSLILCKKLVHFWPLYVPVLLCGNLLLVRTEKYNFWTQLFLILSLIEIRKNYSWNGQRSSNCLKHVRFPQILLLSRICYPNPLYPTRWNLHFLSRRIISKHFFWHINRQSRSWWNFFKHFFTWNFHFHFSIEKLHADDMLRNACARNFKNVVLRTGCSFKRLFPKNRVWDTKSVAIGTPICYVSG